MKRLLLLLSFAGALSAQGLQFTYPYVLTFPTITCSPASCSSTAIIGFRGYGGVSVFATGFCASGIRPYVTPQQTDYFCSYPQTLIYAYAFVSPTPNIYYFSFGQVNAQQLQGNNGTYGYIAGNWVNIFDGVQYSDCYTGALRTFEGPPRPC